MQLFLHANAQHIIGSGIIKMLSSAQDLQLFLLSLWTLPSAVLTTLSFHASLVEIHFFWEEARHSWEIKAFPSGKAAEDHIKMGTEVMTNLIWLITSPLRK